MNECPHDPRPLLDQPIGMYHCPECGEMVVAGMEHPDYCPCYKGETTWWHCPRGHQADPFAAVSAHEEE